MLTEKDNQIIGVIWKVTNLVNVSFYDFKCLLLSLTHIRPKRTVMDPVNLWKTSAAKIIVTKKQVTCQLKQAMTAVKEHALILSLCAENIIKHQYITFISFFFQYRSYKVCQLWNTVELFHAYHTILIAVDGQIGLKLCQIWCSSSYFFVLIKKLEWRCSQNTGMQCEAWCWENEAQVQRPSGEEAPISTITVLTSTWRYEVKLCKIYPRWSQTCRYRCPGVSRHQDICSCRIDLDFPTTTGTRSFT